MVIFREKGDNEPEKKTTGKQLKNFMEKQESIISQREKKYLKKEKQYNVP